jgi:transcriptional regulator with XRE-family HTH domain
VGTDEPRARRAGRRPARRELPADEKPSGAGTLAAKIDRLFRATHPGGGEHGYTAVASAIRRRGGPTISHTYLWQLRRGLRDNPTKQHLEALADFFGVPPSYFFDDAAGPWTEADLELRAASRDGRVRRLALLAHGLSARSLDALADMAELARRAERLGAPHRRETPTGDDGPATRP